MNTTEFQNKVAALAAADRAAYKVGEKGTMLLNYIRNELIKRAFEKDSTLKEKVSIEMSMTVLSYTASVIAILSKANNYPNLLTKTNVEFKDGNITLSYNINVKGLSPEYIEKLNENLNIKISV